MSKDFKPITCPICNEPMKQLVKLIVTTPAGWDRFDKTGIRKKEVQIEGAVFPPDLNQIWCSNHGTLAKLTEEKAK